MVNKRGQLAIFVIIALVIIGIVIILLLYPKIGLPQTTSTELSPENYLKSCIEPEIKPVIENLANQGGYSNPEGVLEYQGEKIKYLCYTSEFYKTCIVQQPMVKEHMEKEVNEIITPKAQECLENLKAEYEKKGYSVSLLKSEINLSIDPHKMLIKFQAPMTISKDTTRTFKNFNVEIKSEMYDLLMLVTSIIDYESTLGDSETTNYISYYPDLSMKKIKLSDGSKIYTLRNVVTNESFRFASRSLSWPPGGYQK